MNNTKGFTLLSALFSLSVLIMILPLLSMSLKLVQQDPHEYTIDVHHFFIFLRNDIIQATEVESTNHSLTLRLGSNVDATYQLYGTVIRRQVQNKGHEIYIRNVQSLGFQQTDHRINIEVTTTNGEKYEKEFQLYE
ncbi:MAG TPA: competence type IV pilus minor pilin ComGF [Bacillota bacterium]|nr:competence type IV pilus minor pilin ComGF [Bacillota bacterium]